MIGKTFLHVIKCILQIDLPSSQTSDAERILLKTYANGAIHAAEIGVFEGLNTANIAKVLSKNGTLYGIDPFFKGKLGVSYGKIIAVFFLIRSGVLNRVKLIDKFSFDAVNDVPDQLDFIFIDGDHSYEGIRRDWEDWSVKLRLGGFIALHDTSIPTFNLDIAKLGSYQFYQEHIQFDKNFKLIASVDSLNVLMKIV